MTELIKKILEKNVVPKLISRAEKKPVQEVEKNEDRKPDKKVLGAVIGAGVAFTALCTAKSLLALKKAKEEKARREREQAREEAAEAAETKPEAPDAGEAEAPGTEQAETEGEA